MIYPQELFDLQEFYDILNLVFDKFQQNNRYKAQKILKHVYMTTTLLKLEFSTLHSLI